LSLLTLSSRPLAVHDPLGREYVLGTTAMLSPRRSSVNEFITAIWSAATCRRFIVSCRQRRAKRRQVAALQIANVLNRTILRDTRPRKAKPQLSSNL
jgi:hypothetical protein